MRHEELLAASHKMGIDTHISLARFPNVVRLSLPRCTRLGRNGATPHRRGKLNCGRTSGLSPSAFFPPPGILAHGSTRTIGRGGKKTHTGSCRRETRSHLLRATGRSPTERTDANEPRP